MTHRPARLPSFRVALLAAAALLGIVAAGATRGADRDVAAALRGRYAALGERIEHSPLQQRLLLESAEDAHSLRGDIWAIVDYPLAAVTTSVTSPAHWCEALILHLNVKYCRPVPHDRGTALSVAIGRKYDQPLQDAFRLELDYRIVATAPDYVAVDLESARGPFGTTNYRLSLEAITVAAGKSFVHLRYQYQFGLEARLAMDAYLATGGSGKVGFTRIDAAGGHEERYVSGVRGVVERNTMRYFLAIDAHLATLATPAPQRFEQSLERWYGATERYPRQLHEVDHATYVAMKHREYARQQTQ